MYRDQAVYLDIRFLGEHHWHHQHLICIFCILSYPLELILHFAFGWLELLPGAIFFAWQQFAVCEQQVLWALTVAEGLAFTKRRAFWCATQKDICCFKSQHKIFAIDFVLDPNTTDGLLIASQDFWSTEFTTGPEIWVLCLVQFACLGPLVATQHHFTSNHICLTQNSSSSDHLILLNAAHFSHCSAFSFDAALHNWEGREIWWWRWWR